MNIKLPSYLIIAFAILFSGIGSVRADEDAATATIVDGKVHVFSAKDKTGVLLKKNDRLQKNQEIRVAEKSRVELKFPDGTVMRFAERSTVKMDDILYDNKTESKKVKVGLTSGKLWASVKKLVTNDSKVEVRTTNAVAGVRGTVYRVNVEDDNSAVVKVYDGSVDVGGIPKDQQPKAAAQGFSAPVPVSGPTQVAAPYHEVSMEEWHVIVKSFQQVTISPKGVASQPQDFTPQQDMDDWVKWNQERDKAAE